MKNEIEQIAQQNEMSTEFVTWFFSEKKAGCGNVWFMMMAAMWEGWKGRSIEMDRLAAENVAARNAVQVFCDVVGPNTDAICEEVGPEGVRAILAAMSATGNMPATDRIVAGIKADGVEEFAKHCDESIGFVETEDEELYTLMEEQARDFAKQLRDGGNGA